MTERIFIIDTETAGIAKPACEIGIIEVDWNLNIIQTWESLLDPEQHILSSASAIHGLLDADVAASPTLKQWSRMTPNPLLYSGAVAPWIVGHKVKFDTDTLGDEVPADHKPACTLRMARNLWPAIVDDGENHQLQTMMYLLDLFKDDAIVSMPQGSGAHRVIYDCRCCLAFMRYMRDKLGLTTQQILNEGQRTLVPETRMWFSSHKGTQLKDLDLGFVAWCRRKPDMDADLIEALAFHMQTR